MSHKDIELERQLLKVQSVVGEGAVQTNVEADIILPAPVRKIREPVEAEVNITATEVIEDKVIVRGVLEKQVYFVDDKTGTLHEKSFEENFSVFVDIHGVEPGHEVQVRPRVEYVGVEEKDNNDKKDYIKEEVFKQLAVIEVFVKVTEKIQLEVVTDAVGPDIEVETELLKVEDVINEDTAQTELISDVTLDNPVRKVESVDTRFEDVESTILDNKVIVQGTLVKQIYFVDPELDVVREHTATENFSVTIDIPGVELGMNVQEFPRVEFVDHEITDDFTLRQTVVVEVFVKVTETVQIEVVTDIKGVETITELLKVSPVIGEDRVQQILEADTKLFCPARKIQQVQGEFRDVEGRVIDDKVIVEGTVHKQIFFVDATTDEVIETSEDIPFTVTIDIPGARPDHQAQISPRIEIIQEEIDQEDSTLIRETIVIEVFVKVTEIAQHEVVVDIEDIKKEKPIKKPKKESGPSMKIYVVQRNDTIYYIAEKFDVVAEDIIKANNIKNPDMIFPGQKLLIPM